MEERRLRIGSIFEWAAAALAVLGLIWVLSGPVQRMLGSPIDASIAVANLQIPPGVPSGATSVPVMMLLDGREIRHGDLRSQLDQVLPAKLAVGSPYLSAGEFGERHTREFLVDGIKFYVVCERWEANGPMRVAGIYLP